MATEGLVTLDENFAVFAEQLTIHNDELNKYLQEWSSQHAYFITNARLYFQQSSGERSSAKDNAAQNQPSYTQSVAEKQVSFEQLVEWPSSNRHPTKESSATENSDDVEFAVTRTLSTPSKISVLDIYDDESLLHMAKFDAMWDRAKRTQTKKWVARKNRFLPCLINSVAFEMVGMGVIVTNSIVMALSADQQMQARTLENDGGFQVLEKVLSMYYVCELMLRFAAERWYFFFAPHATWNMLDLFLVCSSLHELVIEFFEPFTTNGGTIGGNMSFFRIVRLCKMVKMLRILRILRSFRELRLILASMLGSMRTMLSSVMLMLIINFVVALFLMSSISNHVAEQAGNLEPQLAASIDKYWSSVRTAMVSLYMSSTGGESWRFIAEPLKAVSEFFYFCFMLYIAFFLFVIVNTMTSIFIDEVLLNSEKDQQQMIKDQMKKTRQYIALIKRLFAEVDKDGTGKIPRDAFIAQLSSREMMAFLSHAGIDALDAEGFFDILASERDVSTEYGIDIEAFVLGCMKLRGAARSMDLLGFIHKHNTCHSRLQRSVSDCQETLTAMHKQVSDLTRASDAHAKVGRFLGKAKIEVEAHKEIDSSVIGS